jgi:hypothetical protein
VPGPARRRPPAAIITPYHPRPRPPQQLNPSIERDRYRVTSMLSCSAFRCSWMTAAR